MTPHTRDLLDRALSLREDSARQIVIATFPIDCTPDEVRELEPLIEVLHLIEDREYSRGLAVIDRLPSNTRYAAVLRARCLTGSQRYADAVAFVDQTVRERSDLSPADAVGLHFTKGRALTLAQDYQAALTALVQSRTLAAEYGFDTTASRLLVEVATITSYAGDAVRAIAMYEQALLELDDKERFWSERLRVRLNLASCYLDVGRFADALHANDSLLAEDNSRLGDDVLIAVSLNTALALKQLERFDEARERYMRAMEIAERTDETVMLIKACVGLSNLYVRQGDLDTAHEWAARALAHATQAGMDRWGLEARSMIAAIDHECGRSDKAILEMHQCIDAAIEAGDTSTAIALASDLCDWLAELERYREAFSVQQRMAEIRRDIYEKELDRTLEVSAIRSRLDQERENVRLRDEERNKVLHAVFPPAIAARLMSGEMTIADRLDNVALMFVDIVSFTSLASTVDPEDLLALLERLFTGLDRICHAHGCERIKTIGDAYMAVSVDGATLQENTERIVRAALDMIDPAQGLAMPPERLRIGLHCGPVIAGVMGGARLSYDMWGDTVNVAARMEEHSAPGRITCSPLVEELLRDHAQVRFEKREPLAIHGKGLMTTYWLSAT